MTFFCSDYDYGFLVGIGGGEGSAFCFYLSWWCDWEGYYFLFFVGEVYFIYIYFEGIKGMMQVTDGSSFEWGRGW